MSVLYVYVTCDGKIKYINIIYNKKMFLCFAIFSKYLPTHWIKLNQPLKILPTNNIYFILLRLLINLSARSIINITVDFRCNMSFHKNFIIVVVSFHHIIHNTQSIRKWTIKVRLRIISQEIIYWNYNLVEVYGKKKSTGRPSSLSDRDKWAILRVASNSQLTANNGKI